MYDEITNLEQYNDHQSKSHFEKKKKKKIAIWNYIKLLAKIANIIYPPKHSLYGTK